MTLGERIKEQRTKCGFSQEDDTIPVGQTVLERESSMEQSKGTIKLIFAVILECRFTQSIL